MQEQVPSVAGVPFKEHRWSGALSRAWALQREDLRFKPQLSQLLALIFIKSVFLTYSVEMSTLQGVKPSDGLCNGVSEIPGGT